MPSVLQQELPVSSLLGVGKSGKARAKNSLPFTQPPLVPSPTQIVETLGVTKTFRLSGVREEILLDQATRIESSEATTQGSATGLTLQRNATGAQTKKALLRPSSWDLPLYDTAALGTDTKRLPWHDVLAANLVFDIPLAELENTASCTVTAHVISDANKTWTEAGATWTTRDGSAAWVGSNGCETPDVDYYSDLLGEVQVRPHIGTAALRVRMPLDLDLLWLAFKLGSGILLQIGGVPYPVLTEVSIISDDAGDTGRRPRLEIFRRYAAGVDTQLETGKVDQATSETESLWVNAKGTGSLIYFGGLSSEPQSLLEGMNPFSYHPTQGEIFVTLATNTSVRYYMQREP
jgi:hypothetical protein